MDWSTNLPDVDQWQPQSSKRGTLGDALMMSCQIAQRRVVAAAEAEANFNIQNFDSGPGVEDIVREELSNLVPKRYSISAGVVNDRSGNTAGDCDLLVRDHMWSPVIKPGATNQSRRFHFPIEGIYAAIEIKQTLGYKQLDEAMEKLVKISRLDRPDNPYGHITENQHITNFDRAGYLLNPLFTSILAVRIEKGISFENLVDRFGEINALLDRHDMVTMFCILDHGTAWYSVASGSPYDADFMRDRDQELILQINKCEPNNTFYRMYVMLMMHSTRSVLRLTKTFGDYGRPPPNREVRQYPTALFNKPIPES